MNIPISFYAMCRVFHQDADTVFASHDEMISFGLRQVPSNERPELKKFILNMLDLPGGEIQDIWWSTCAELVFPDDEKLRSFLRQVTIAL